MLPRHLPQAASPTGCTPAPTPSAAAAALASPPAWLLLAASRPTSYCPPGRDAGAHSGCPPPAAHQSSGGGKWGGGEEGSQVTFSFVPCPRAADGGRAGGRGGLWWGMAALVWAVTAKDSLVPPGRGRVGEKGGRGISAKVCFCVPCSAGRQGRGCACPPVVRSPRTRPRRRPQPFATRHALLQALLRACPPTGRHSASPLLSSRS